MATRQQRRLYRAELVGADPVWLLEVLFAGRMWRWSTRPVTPSNADGDELPFDGGLNEFSIPDALTLLSSEANQRSVAVEVIPSASWAQLVARGHDPLRARGSLSIWVPGTTYEDRQIVLEGQLVQPLYGEAGEPITFSLEDTPLVAGGLFPAETLVVGDEGFAPTSSELTGIAFAAYGFISPHVVTIDTSSSAPDRAVGRIYPTVIGRPGFYTRAGEPSISTAQPGSPGIVIDEGATTVNKILVAGHWVNAGSLRLKASDGSTEVVSVTNGRDDLGRKVATVTPTSTTNAAGNTFLVQWQDSNGTLAAVDRPSADMKGAGEVLEWMLRQTTLPIDRGRLSAARAELDSIQVAGYIDDTVVPFVWIQDNLLPILPVSIRRGPQGLYPVVWRWRATVADAIAWLSEGDDLHRTGPVEYVTTPDEVSNALTIEYGWTIDDDTYRGRLSIGPNPSTSEATETGSALAEASAARYGRRAAVEEM